MSLLHPVVVVSSKSRWKVGIVVRSGRGVRERRRVRIVSRALSTSRNVRGVPRSRIHWSIGGVISLGGMRVVVKR